MNKQSQVLNGQLSEIETEINDFIRLLNTAKFEGVAADGSRKDWIAKNDVIERLKNLRLLSLPRFN